MTYLIRYEVLSARIYYLLCQTFGLFTYIDSQASGMRILEDTNRYIYSNSRDRIYAILNLIYPKEISGFDTDYLKSIEEVF